MSYSIVQCLRKYFYWYFVKVSKGQGLPSLPGQLSHLRPRPPLSVCLLLSVFLLRTNRRLIVIVASGPLPYVDTPLGSPSSPPSQRIGFVLYLLYLPAANNVTRYITLTLIISASSPLPFLYPVDNISSQSLSLDLLVWRCASGVCLLSLFLDAPFVLAPRSS